MTDVVLVLTTVPSVEVGETIARTLVDERLAACVNLLAPMTSWYRWQGAVERASESQIVIKTTRTRIRAVEARIGELHPYALPEFLVLGVEGGGSAYLSWIASETV